MSNTSELTSNGAVEEQYDERGIIMGVGGYYRSVMRFQPPLTIDGGQLERAVNGLESAIEVNAR